MDLKKYIYDIPNFPKEGILFRDIMCVILWMQFILDLPQDFPWGALVKTPCVHCRGAGLIPDWRTEFPHATWCGQKVKKKISFSRYKCQATYFMGHKRLLWKKL